MMKAKQLGANMITIMVDYGADNKGRATVHQLYGFRWSKHWRSELAEMIDYAHRIGLAVEIKNAEVSDDVEVQDFVYEGEPEDYVAGYPDSTKELAKIAEEHHVYQFTIWTEADHIAMQGVYGTIDREHFDTIVISTLNDWSQRMLNVVREESSGKVGIGFSGIPESFEILDSLDIKGFDYLEFSFYGDIYDDYVFNTGVNALETIKEYKEVAEMNGIDTLIIGETALEESVGDLSSMERQQIYNEYFQLTHSEVDGYFLMMFPPNPDDDLQVVAKEWYGKL